jgi:hypothetical protein
VRGELRVLELPLERFVQRAARAGGRGALSGALPREKLTLESAIKVELMQWIRANRGAATYDTEAEIAKQTTYCSARDFKWMSLATRSCPRNYWQALPQQTVFPFSITGMSRRYLVCTFSAHPLRGGLGRSCTSSRARSSPHELSLVLSLSRKARLALNRLLEDRIGRQND